MSDAVRHGRTRHQGLTGGGEECKGEIGTEGKGTKPTRKEDEHQSCRAAEMGGLGSRGSNEDGSQRGLLRWRGSSHRLQARRYRRVAVLRLRLPAVGEADHQRLAIGLHTDAIDALKRGGGLGHAGEPYHGGP